MFWMISSLYLNKQVNNNISERTVKKKIEQGDEGK